MQDPGVEHQEAGQEQQGGAGQARQPAQGAPEGKVLRKGKYVEFPLVISALFLVSLFHELEESAWGEKYLGALLFCLCIGHSLHHAYDNPSSILESKGKVKETLLSSFFVGIPLEAGEPKSISPLIHAASRNGENNPEL